jgi:ABC-type transport system involved in multi-copper enzyme maturation permease subunit
MASVVQSSAAWLRRNVAWSNSRQSWQERLGALALLAGAATAWWFGGRLSLAQHVVVWGLLLLALVALMRRGWLKLFGPVLFYDLVTIARRRRYVLLRLLYAILLTLVLVWVYFLWTLRTPGGTVPVKEMAEFGQSFFFTFMCLQFLAIGVLTPAYTAGAIADEKDRRTLEFLLATDLRNREIVLSKLLARLANMGLFVLTGLPILSLTQFFGGIDPDLLLAAFAAIGLTMASLGGVSILTSVYAKKPRDAIVLTYLAVAAYLGLSSLSLILLNYPVASVALTPGSGPVTVEDVIEAFNAGNIPYVLFGKLLTAWGSGKALADILPGLLGRYAAFHGLVAVVCAVWAVLRLRGVALRQMYGRAQKGSLAARFWIRPRVGGQPMLWKEVFAEPGLRFNWMGRIIIAVLFIVSFIPAAWIFVNFLSDTYGINAGSGPGFRPYRRTAVDELSENMNSWARTVGMIVACLTLLGVAVRASTSVSGERDRQTLDGLFTTPLGSNAILFAKWAGSIVSVRWAWLWLALIWGIGLITTGINPLALPLLFGAWLVYAASCASVGVWFSTVCRTSLRATIWTLVVTVSVAVGHWVVMWMCCIMPLLLVATGPARELEYVAKFEFGVTPPAVLWWLGFRTEDFTESFNRKEAWELTGFALLGLVCYALAAAVVWGIAANRFRAVAGRVPLPRPQRPPPRPQRAPSPALPVQPTASPTSVVVAEEVPPDARSA